MSAKVVANIILVVLCVGCTQQNNIPERKVDPLANERDLKELQGKWQLISEKRDGKELHEAPCHYIFKDATMTTHPQGKQASYYTLKLDATKSPKEMDIVATFDDGRVVAAKVIYEIDGDTLRWCYGRDNNRPNSFPGETLYIARRAKE
jgi:uncharacterized protein (TIGR03067 family)